jgi:hypothetical protein
MNIVGILVTCLVALIAYWILAHVSVILGLVAAVLVLLGGIRTGGLGLGSGRGAA